jgi:hypothetical protein
LVILGLHRTGSTLLQTLLSLDPNARTPLTWEMMETIPLAQTPEERLKNSSINALNDRLQKVDLFCPGFIQSLRQGHYFAFDAPEEDTMALFGIQRYWSASHFYFGSEVVSAMQQNKEFHAKYICRYLHMFFKLLDSKNPPKSHWVTKNPDHSQYLEQLVDEFPKANLIVTYRDPVSVIPSWLKLTLVAFHYNLYHDLPHLLPVSSSSFWF